MGVNVGGISKLSYTLARLLAINNTGFAPISLQNAFKIQEFSFRAGSTRLRSLYVICGPYARYNEFLNVSTSIFLNEKLEEFFYTNIVTPMYLPSIGSG